MRETSIESRGYYAPKGGLPGQHELHTGRADPAVLVMRYDWRNNSVLFVHNLSESPREVRFEVGLPGDQGKLLVNLLSVSRNLERIADHAVNVAEDVIYMAKGDILRHRRPRTRSAADPCRDAPACGACRDRRDRARPNECDPGDRRST